MDDGAQHHVPRASPLGFARATQETLLTNLATRPQPQRGNLPKISTLREAEQEQS